MNLGNRMLIVIEESFKNLHDSKKIDSEYIYSKGVN